MYSRNFRNPWVGIWNSYSVMNEYESGDKFSTRYLNMILIISKLWKSLRPIKNTNRVGVKLKPLEVYLDSNSRKYIEIDRWIDR